MEQSQKNLKQLGSRRGTLSLFAAPFLSSVLTLTVAMQGGIGWASQNVDMTEPADVAGSLRCSALWLEGSGAHLRVLEKNRFNAPVYKGFYSNRGKVVVSGDELFLAGYRIEASAVKESQNAGAGFDPDRRESRQYRVSIKVIEIGEAGDHEFGRLFSGEGRDQARVEIPVSGREGTRLAASCSVWRS